jgi:succinate dehydrogenase / fumarate reductase cytochrome b subunit
MKIIPSSFGLSSIGKKLIMSISGLFLMVFLLLHLGINLTAIFSESAYNAACEFMNTNILIQLMVPVLALGFVVHICLAIYLSWCNLWARPVGYAVSSKTKATSWAAQNMLVLGFIVIGLLAVHLSHFWAKMQLQEFMGGHTAENPYLLVKATFENPVWALIYLAWIAAIWFHLTHGFWSALQTIGFNNKTWLKRLQVAATAFATLVALGFAAVVLWFLFGFAPQRVEDETDKKCHATTVVSEASHCPHASAGAACCQHAGADKSCHHAELKDALIIINGEVADTTALKKISRDSILSVEVLKDSAAINLCGGKGLNGVILIRTK